MNIHYYYITSKINNETIKFKNGKYYAIVNVVTDYAPWPL